ncbi:MAG: ATP-binding protein, partial [Chloroflexota bacterium]
LPFALLLFASSNELVSLIFRRLLSDLLTVLTISSLFFNTLNFYENAVDMTPIVQSKITKIETDIAIVAMNDNSQNEAEIILGSLQQFLNTHIHNRNILLTLEIGDIVEGKVTTNTSKSGRAILDILVPIQTHRYKTDTDEESSTPSGLESDVITYMTTDETYSALRHSLRGLGLRCHLAATILSRQLNNNTDEKNTNIEDIRSAHDKVVNSVDSMRSLMNSHFDILIHSRSASKFGVQKIVRDVAKQATVICGALKNFDVTIELNLPRQPIFVYGRDYRLEQALYQLLINSIQSIISFIGNSGKVWIKGEIRDSNVELIIKDTGAGIPRSSLAHIFEPFYTLDSERMGLGLTVSQHIIEAEFQGTVRVTSIRYIGTSIIITLPLLES